MITHTYIYVYGQEHYFLIIWYNTAKQFRDPGRREKYNPHESFFTFFPSLSLSSLITSKLLANAELQSICSDKWLKCQSSVLLSGGKYICFRSQTCRWHGWKCWENLGTWFIFLPETEHPTLSGKLPEPHYFFSKNSFWSTHKLTKQCFVDKSASQNVEETALSFKMFNA